MDTFPSAFDDDKTYRYLLLRRGCSVPDQVVPFKAKRGSIGPPSARCHMFTVSPQTSPVSDTPVYAHPVVAGRRIFVRDANTVTLWTLDPSSESQTMP